MPVVVPEIEKQNARDEALRLQAARRAGAAAPDAAGPGHAAAAAADALLRRHRPQRRPQGRVDAAAARGAATRAPGAAASPRRRSPKTTSSSTWTAPPGLPTPVHKGTAPPRASPGAATTRRAGAQAQPGPGAEGPGAAPPCSRQMTTKTTWREPDACSAAASAESRRRSAAETPPPAPVQRSRQRLPRLARLPRRAAAAAGQDGAPTLLNSRSLTGFPSATVGYSIYEVAPPQQTRRRRCSPAKCRRCRAA